MTFMIYLKTIFILLIIIWLIYWNLWTSPVQLVLQGWSKMIRKAQGSHVMNRKLIKKWIKNSRQDFLNFHWAVHKKFCLLYIGTSTIGLIAPNCNADVLKISTKFFSFFFSWILDNIPVHFDAIFILLSVDISKSNFHICFTIYNIVIDNCFTSFWQTYFDAMLKGIIFSHN